MFKTSKSVIHRLALILFMLMIISTCLIGGTFASLSASYVWHSETAESGSFDYTDSTYSFSLFGKSDLFPGDSGQNILSGSSFGDNNVSWSFSETNLNSMPIIYYILDKDNSPVGLYSKYDFANEHEGLFIKLANTIYCSVNDISTSSKKIAVRLSIGETLHWLWPKNLYTEKDANGNHNINLSDTAKKYQNLNEKLCVNSYAYTTDTIDLFKESAATYFATSQTGEMFNVTKFDKEKLTLVGDFISHDSKIMPIYVNGNFVDTPSTKLISQDFYYIFVPLSRLDNLKQLALEKSIKIEFLDGNFAQSRDIEMSQSSNGVYNCVKVFPVGANARAIVQVSITAFVTK